VLTCPTTPSLYANDYTQTCVSSTFTIMQPVHGVLSKHFTTITIEDVSSVSFNIFRLPIFSSFLRLRCFNKRYLRSILSCWNLLVRFKPYMCNYMSGLLLHQLHSKYCSISMRGKLPLKYIFELIEQSVYKRNFMSQWLLWRPNQ